MLVKKIKRGDGATILIGDDVSVKVKRGEGEKVTLVVDAPSNIRIVLVDTDSNSVE